jgi:hypothetical protein
MAASPVGVDRVFERKSAGVGDSIDQGAGLNVEKLKSLVDPAAYMAIHHVVE